MAFLIHSRNSGNLQWTAPPGWTQIGDDIENRRYKASAWYRVIDGTPDADYTWDVSIRGRIAGAMFAISGADPANPINAQSAIEENLPIDVDVTTDVDDSLLLLWGAYDASSQQTWTNPDGMTEHFDETVTQTELTHAGWTGPSGPAGTSTRTVDGSSGGSPIGWLIAIAPG